jgi:hypothetical protein
MRRLAVIAVVLVAVPLGAGLARGELVQRGNVRLSFSASFAPQALPRERQAPVSVRFGGSIANANGGRPPALRRISFAVNRNGFVYTNGLPICSSGSLEATSTEQARSICGPALVGRGRFLADVTFSSHRPFPVEGRVLAFNSRVGGRPAILLHIYGTNPVKITVVLAFKIYHPKQGQFGTVFRARIPSIASNLGYVTEMSLLLNRRYRFGGRTRSLFSARCAAPTGFPSASFTFAKGRFEFDNGQRLTPSLTRSCQVR